MAQSAGSAPEEASGTAEAAAGKLSGVTAPLVSVTTPTFNRPHKHEGLYKTFCEQTYEPRELVVLDGSAEPSPFFSALKDERVRYFHEPEAPREGGVTRIGAIRNRLTQLAKGEILASFDDDDQYAADFVAEAVRRLEGADLFKLVVWRLLHGDDVYLWDQRIIGGPVYALRGSTVELTDTDGMSPEEAAAFRDAWQLGFMWSAVFRKSVALEIPFPEEGTEDIPWMRALVEAGKKIVMVADAPHLALHVVEPNPVHAEGGSPHFPQVKLRAASAKRMMGAGIAAMNELPQEQSVQIEPGKVYRILAAIKKSHSIKSVETRAAHWGVRLTESIDNVDPAQYGVQPPPEGYRLVDFIGTGDKAVTLPWQAPRFMKAIGERSQVVRAWIGAGRPDDGIDDAWMVRVFVGAAAAHETLGPKGRNEGAASDDANPSRYDPKRFAGREPPHKCTAKSANAIAQQLPGAPWVFAGNVASHDGMREQEATIMTGMGPKTIPYWTDNMLPDGGRNRGTMAIRLVLQCPFTGEIWAWFQPNVMPRLGAGRQLGAGFDTSQFTQQSPKSYAVNAVAGQSGLSVGAVDQIASQFTSNDPGQIAIAVDATILTIFGGPGAGAAFEQAVSWIESNLYQQPPPCTIPGCDIPGTRPCSSMDYSYSTLATENYVHDSTALYPGTFEDVFTRTLHAAWDSQVTAPRACELLKGGVDLLEWANKYLGGVVAPFVAAWNKAHPPMASAPSSTYKITGPVSYGGLGLIFMALSAAGQAGGLPPDATVSVEINAWAPGGVFPPGIDWPNNPHPCPDGAYWDGSKCTMPALPGSNCPAGQVWNGFKCVPSVGGKIVAPNSGGSSGLLVVGVLAGVAAAAAGGVGLYAWRSGQSYGDAWKRVLGIAEDQATASGKLLAAANPQRLVLKA